jgi:hypothetical protein
MEGERQGSLRMCFYRKLCDRGGRVGHGSGGLYERRHSQHGR